MAEPAGRRAVFLDRDCTVFEDLEYSADIGRLKLLPGAVEGLKRLQEAGYALVIVTNQAGIARGFFTEPELVALHDHMRKWLADQGVRVEGIYSCPHFPEGVVEKYVRPCDCRKPQPGMLLRAAREIGIDLAASWMIGDRPTDIAAGKAAGCRTIRVLSKHPPQPGDPKPDFDARDLVEAADTILES